MSDALFEMTFRPKPELITVIRRFITAVYDRLHIDSALADQVALTAHELLENATKYSTDGEASLHMEVTGTSANPQVRLRTKNRVSAEDRARVAACVDELARAADPLAFYLELMRRAIASSRPGGLGLGRIVAEGDMSLTIEGTGDLLELVATHRGGAS
jgi:hypothetical protein